MIVTALKFPCQWVSTCCLSTDCCGYAVTWCFFQTWGNYLCNRSWLLHIFSCHYDYNKIWCNWLRLLDIPIMITITIKWSTQRRTRDTFSLTYSNTQILIWWYLVGMHNFVVIVPTIVLLLVVLGGTHSRFLNLSKLGGSTV